jgi:Domain of unknown function (DUF2828)
MTKQTQNPFLQAVMQYNVYTENGALSHSTTGAGLLDYFAKSGTYRDRSIDDVYKDMGKIWGESPLIALQIAFYNRIITRASKGLFVTDNVQRGQGMRDEFRKAASWVAKYQPETFYKNMWLLPVVGCWKDLWHEDLLPALDKNKVYELVQMGIADDYNRDLIAKFLPKIRSQKQVYNDRHKAMNEFAFGLCKHLGWTAKEYRLFKSNGQAHVFQRFMQDGLWDKLDFARIAGKALFQMVNSKGKDNKTVLERHNLEPRYLAWLNTQPIAKFTGYVYELFRAAYPNNSYGASKISLAQRNTLNKQFDGLIELAKKGTGGIRENVWSALDTSGSMTWETIDSKGTHPIDVCISLGVYFATLNEGTFHKNIIAFNEQSKVIQLSGEFTDMCQQAMTCGGWGSTNFQSVIDEIVRVRTQRPDVPIADFPTTLLVVSDMQFNVASSKSKTNYETAMEKLRVVGLGDMKIIWWWVTSRGKDFPSTISDAGVTMIGGFDGSVVSLIIGGETTTIDKVTGETRQLNPIENMLKALNQDVLQQIKL